MVATRKPEMAIKGSGGVYEFGRVSQVNILYLRIARTACVGLSELRSECVQQVDIRNHINTFTIPIDILNIIMSIYYIRLRNIYLRQSLTTSEPLKTLPPLWPSAPAEMSPSRPRESKEKRYSLQG